MIPDAPWIGNPDYGKTKSYEDEEDELSFYTEERFAWEDRDEYELNDEDS